MKFKAHMVDPTSDIEPSFDSLQPFELLFAEASYVLLSFKLQVNVSERTLSIFAEIFFFATQSYLANMFNDKFVMLDTEYLKNTRKNEI